MVVPLCSVLPELHRLVPFLPQRSSISFKLSPPFTCPARDNQIINTGMVPLRCLAVSTRMSPEVGDYPDSGKFGEFADFGPGADGQPQMFRFIGRAAAQVNYWDGE